LDGFFLAGGIGRNDSSRGIVLIDDLHLSRMDQGSQVGAGDIAQPAQTLIAPLKSGFSGKLITSRYALPRKAGHKLSVSPIKELLLGGEFVLAPVPSLPQQRCRWIHLFCHRRAGALEALIIERGVFFEADSSRCEV